MHIVKLLEYRFPKSRGRMMAVLMLVSLGFLLLGLGLMRIQ